MKKLMRSFKDDKRVGDVCITQHLIASPIHAQRVLNRIDTILFYPREDFIDAGLCCIELVVSTLDFGKPCIVVNDKMMFA